MQTANLRMFVGIVIILNGILFLAIGVTSTSTAGFEADADFVLVKSLLRDQVPTDDWYTHFYKLAERRSTSRLMLFAILGMINAACGVAVMMTSRHSRQFINSK